MWNRIKWKIQSFMIGRNGYDELNRALIYVAIVIDLIAIVISRFFALAGSILSLISYVILAIYLFRIFSKNIIKRRQENDKYKGLLSLWKMRFQQRKDYKIFKCKGCGRNIRIPRGKGKIEVRCPMCGDITIHRT